ncbi:hypothetical protein QUB60_19410, partial [Microcoleus sp. A2-C5]
WLLVIGYWLLVIGYWLLVIGYWLLVKFRLPITQELARLLVWEIGDRASYSLESFEFDYCTKSDKK